MRPRRARGRWQFRCCRVAGDGGDLGSDSLFQDLRHDVVRTSDTGGAALWWLFGPDDIAHGFERRVGAPEKHHVVVFERADPLKFWQVKLNFLCPESWARYALLCGARIVNPSGLATPDVVRSRDRARPRHVLDDNVRVPRYVFDDMPRQHSCRPVISSTAAKPDDDTDLLTLVERLALRPDRRCEKQKN